MKTLLTLLGFSILFCSFLVITVMNPIHSALFLILAFVQSSFLLVLVGCDFLGLSIIIIYVGAISVLFVFVIMLINTQFLTVNNHGLGLMPFMLFLSFILLSYLKSIFFSFSNSFSLGSLFFVDWSETLSLNLITKIASYLYDLNALNLSFIAIVLLLAMVNVIFLTNVSSFGKKQDLFNQIYFSQKSNKV